jgi:hypothetical protein
VSEWKEQWERLGRWYGRLQKLAGNAMPPRGGTPAGLTAVEAQGENERATDDIYAFFHNCYHLRDWLAQDSASGVTKSEVDQAIRNSPALSICADICNRAKHFELTLKPWTGDPQAGTIAQHATVAIGVGVYTSWEFLGAGNRYDAFRLANDCMSEWETFLQGRGLL